jgi:hypothetical protein
MCGLYRCECISWSIYQYRTVCACLGGLNPPTDPVARSCPLPAPCLLLCGCAAPVTAALLPTRYYGGQPVGRELDPMPDLPLTAAAAQLGTTPTALRKRLQRGHSLRGWKIDGQWWVSLPDTRVARHPPTGRTQAAHQWPGSDASELVACYGAR